MKIERMLIRSLSTGKLIVFTGPVGSELIGRCSQCEGLAKLVRVPTTDGAITSHQAIEGINCDHREGTISVVKCRR